AEMEIAFDRLHADALLPDFLPYEVTDVTLAGRFLKDTISLRGLHGRHGPARLHMGPSVIVIKPKGGMWGHFQNIQLTPLIPDEEFRTALPPTLRSLCTALEPTGPMSLNAGLVIVDLAPTSDEHEQSRLQVRQTTERTVRMSQAALTEAASP